MKTPTNQEYQNMVKEYSPNSPLLKNVAFAFLIGGAICAVGQIFRGIFENNMDKLSLTKDEVGTLVSAVMVFIGALFTALGLYDRLAKYGGAGTLVPITGFANAVVSPAIEFRAEGIVTGVCAKMFTIAGPVIVFATVAGILYGAIYYLTTIIG